MLFCGGNGQSNQGWTFLCNFEKRKIENGLSSECSVVLHSNVDEPELDSTCGAVVEEETGGCAAESDINEVPALVREVAKEIVNRGAAQGEEPKKCLLHRLHSSIFHVEVVKKRLTSISDCDEI